MDGKFKLWAEDATLPPLSGRRFNSRSNRPVFDLRSPHRAPFLSFDIKHNPETRHTFLALLDRSAMLTVYENEEPESMASWVKIDEFLVCEKPARGEEASFKVSFDPNLEPSFNAIREGVPRDSLGIIVAGMNTARIWRTKIVSHDVSLGSGSNREFYRAADLPGHRALVRDVAWAPGSVRGFDICATACKDGLVRIFEFHTPPKDGTIPSAFDYTKYPTSQAVVPVNRPGDPASRSGPSGIGAELATVRSAPGGNRQQDGAPRTGQVKTVVREVGRLDSHRGPVWRVEFDEDGQMLGSCGDDGRVLLWRRRPDGLWIESAELGLTRSIPGV
jgi:nucleoporin SEH1